MPITENKHSDPMLHGKIHFKWSLLYALFGGQFEGKKHHVLNIFLITKMVIKLHNLCSNLTFQLIQCSQEVQFSVGLSQCIHLHTAENANAYQN